MSKQIANAEGVVQKKSTRGSWAVRYEGTREALTAAGVATCEMFPAVGKKRRGSGGFVRCPEYFATTRLDEDRYAVTRWAFWNKPEIAEAEELAEEQAQAEWRVDRELERPVPVPLVRVSLCERYPGVLCTKASLWYDGRAFSAPTVRQEIEFTAPIAVLRAHELVTPEMLAHARSEHRFSGRHKAPPCSLEYASGWVLTEEKGRLPRLSVFTDEAPEDEPRRLNRAATRGAVDRILAALCAAR